MEKLKFNKWLLVLSIFFYSCESWINVTPTDRLSEDMLFSDRDGFVKALNAIYIELNSDELYGLNLTAGALDVMGQYYAISSSTHTYYNLAQLVYTNTEELNIFNNIWKKSYLLIANCNTIIEECEKPDVNLTEPYLSMIEGESLALRAMLHFDLLRLFGPLTSELDKQSIPYQTASGQIITPLLPGTQVLDSITKDLQNALALLAISDPYLAQENDLEFYTETDLDYRQYRMNYFAVKALLARVYLWAGKPELAFTTATDVIEEANGGEVERFPFVTYESATSSSPDRVFSTEVLFGSYNSDRTNIFEILFAPTLESTSLLTLAGTLSNGRVTEMYDDENDYRYKIWSTYNNNGISVLYNRKYEELSSNVDFNNMVPLIRLAEMYLIAAECCTNETEAVGYLNTLRNARNCFSVYPTADLLQDYIMNEYRREMLGEGQVFYYYKRKELVNIPDGGQATGMKNVDLSKYVIPLPDSETSQRTTVES